MTEQERVICATVHGLLLDGVPEGRALRQTATLLRLKFGHVAAVWNDALAVRENDK